MKYSVKTISVDGFVAYLSHKGNLSWSRRTALKYAREFVAKFGGTAKVEQELT